MKTILTIPLLLLLMGNALAQNTNPKYDSTLAKAFGGDEYGMKMYVFVMLKSGPNNTKDQAVLDSCFRGHMNNIQRLVDTGHLVVAGPIAKNDSAYRGIFILKATSFDEAKEMLKPDTALSSGILSADYYKWYGSAALPAYLEVSDKIWEKGH